MGAEDFEANRAALAAIFPGKPDEETDRKKRTLSLLDRAARYRWTWAEFIPDAGMDETWWKGLWRYMVRAPTGGAHFAPSWVQPVVSALAERYVFKQTLPAGRSAPAKLGKVSTPFLEMCLSWSAAGQQDAEHRAKALAAVIALARDRRDVDARVNHFINEYDGP